MQEKIMREGHKGASVIITTATVAVQKGHKKVGGVTIKSSVYINRKSSKNKQRNRLDRREDSNQVRVKQMNKKIKGKKKKNMLCKYKYK